MRPQRTNVAIKKATVWSLRDLMTRDPVVLSEEMSLDEALSMLERYRFRHFPVARGSSLVGMVSDRDLRLATALWTTERRAWPPDGKRTGEPQLVREIMRRPVYSLPPNETPAQAARDMVRLRIGAIPVVEDESLVGIVTETDCLEAFIELCRGHRGCCDAFARDHQHKPMPLIEGDASLPAALDAMDRDVAHLCIQDRGRLAGIVSERDLFSGLARERIRDAQAEDHARLVDVALSVHDVMCDDVRTVEGSTLLSSCAGILLAHRISALPVLEEREPVGILSQRDILRYYASIYPEVNT
jgi:CBS domain-containing protein